MSTAKVTFDEAAMSVFPMDLGYEDPILQVSSVLQSNIILLVVLSM